VIRQAVPWLTSVFTLWAMWLLAKKRWQGWVVGLFNQVLWVATAVLFRTWGLLPLTAALIVVYIRGLVDWRRAEVAA
jgi:hypothetical protein